MRCGLLAAKGVVGLLSVGDVWYLRLPCFICHYARCVVCKESWMYGWCGGCGVSRCCCAGSCCDRVAEAHSSSSHSAMVCSADDHCRVCICAPRRRPRHTTSRHGVHRWQLAQSSIRHWAAEEMLDTVTVLDEVL